MSLANSALICVNHACFLRFLRLTQQTARILSLDLNLFGPFSLTRSGEPVELKNKKAQALLAYLAVTGTPQTREHLATLLWGDRFDDQARASLRQALFALRKAVGPDVVEGEDELSLMPGRLQTRNPTPNDNTPYAGDLLPGFATGADGFDRWLETERTSHRQSALDQYRAALDTAPDNDDIRSFLCDQILAIEPLDEATVRTLMALKVKAGLRNEAISAFAEFRDRLRRELDAEPEPVTMELEAEIRSGTIRQVEKSIREKAFAGRILVAPTEDLGGGEIASFLAHEIPTAFVSSTFAGAMLDVRLLTISTEENSQDAAFKKAKEAGGRFIVTGSARQIGDKVRLAYQTHATSSGELINSHSDIISVDEAFDYLETISSVFVSAAQRTWRHSSWNEINTLDKFRAASNNTEEFTALLLDHFIGIHHTKNNLAAFEEADRVADYALEILPNHPIALNFKAWSVYSLWDMKSGKTRREKYQEAAGYFDRALAQDPALPGPLVGRMSVSYWLGEFDETERCHEAMGELISTTPALKAIYANSLIFRDRIAEAIERYKEAIPAEAGLKTLLNRFAMFGLAFFCIGNYDEALRNAENSLAIGPDYWVTHIVRIAALERLGRHDECAGAIADYAAMYPDPTVSELDWLPFTNPETKADFLGALRDAGLPEE